jgi:uncharacterized protein YndB with AHSA1/START domain
MSAPYRFLTTWLFDAPRDRVWEVIYDGARWPEWWRGVLRTEILEPGGESGEGALWRSSWRSVLPYTLDFDFRVETVERPTLLAGRASGDIVGTGTWRLYESALGTASTWEWHVAPSRTWLHPAARLARPIVTWDHDRLMRWGGEGAARRIGCRLVAAA